MYIFKHSEGFAQIFEHYLFFNMGQDTLSMDKYLMAIYLCLGMYKLLLFPHPCLMGLEVYFHQHPLAMCVCVSSKALLKLHICAVAA